MSAWSLKFAQIAFEQGRIQEWIEAYLQVPEWENLGLLRRVREYSNSWLAPQLFEISRLHRVAGPGDSYRFPKDPATWNQEVNAILSGRPNREEFPPIIAWRELDGVLNVADGNHRLDALTRLGYEEAWVLLHDGPLRSKEELSRRTDLNSPNILNPC